VISTYADHLRILILRLKTNGSIGSALCICADLTTGRWPPLLRQRPLNDVKTVEGDSHLLDLPGFVRARKCGRSKSSPSWTQWRYGMGERNGNYLVEPLPLRGNSLLANRTSPLHDKLMGHSSFIMKIRFAATSLSIIICNFSIDFFGNKAMAGGNFFCSAYGGSPVTMKSTTSGKNVPIIMWKSNAFTADGWAPEKRCQEVSQRFNQLHLSGRLRFLTTGRINGLPVICAAISDGAGCVDGGLLYTLKPGQNAGDTLRNLLAIRVKATGPLTESTARPYISLEEIELAAGSIENTNEEPLKSNQAVIQSTPVNVKQVRQIKQSVGQDALW